MRTYVFFVFLAVVLFSFPAFTEETPPQAECPAIPDINTVESLAQPLREAGNWQGVLEVLECARRQQIDDPLLLQWGGRCHEALGQSCEAAGLYRQFIGGQASEIEPEARAELERRIRRLQEQCRATSAPLTLPEPTPPPPPPPVFGRTQPDEPNPEPAEPESTPIPHPDNRLRIAGWVLASIGLAGIASGTISWIVAGVQYYGDNPYETPIAAYAGDWLIGMSAIPTLVGAVLLIIDQVRRGRARASPTEESEGLLFDGEEYAFVPY